MEPRFNICNACLQSYKTICLFKWRQINVQLHVVSVALVLYVVSVKWCHSRHSLSVEKHRPSDGPQRNSGCPLVGPRHTISTTLTTGLVSLLKCIYTWRKYVLFRVYLLRSSGSLKMVAWTDYWWVTHSKLFGDPNLGHYPIIQMI